MKQSIGNVLRTLKLVWALCKSRVIHEGVISLLSYVEWLFFSSIFLRYIISAVEKQQDIYQIFIFIGITALFFSMASLYKNYVVNAVQPLTDTCIYKKLYKKLYQKSSNVELRCFEDNKFYDKYTMAVDQADQKVTLIIKNFFTIVFGGIATIIAFIIMYQIDEFAMFFLISPLIGNFVFGTLLNKIVFKRYQDTIPEVRSIEYVNRVMYLSDYAKEIRLTKVFPLIMQKYKQAVEKTASIAKQYSKKAVLVYWLHTMLTFTIFQGVFLYGVYKSAISKSMPLSDLAVLVSATVATTWILIGVTNAFMENINYGLYMKNLFEFLKYKEEIPEDFDGIIPEERIHSIEFQNVSFGYKNDELIIKDISFKVSNKTKVALVGQNGAGKSTIIKLLLRMYDPTKGTILVNGIDIKKYNLAAYRNLYGVALQDYKIFSMSIKDNILMGKRVKDEETVVKDSLMKAGIYDKIMQMPNGIDTILTKEFYDDGEVFSGGQYQKIAVARVFAHNAPVNVFDEPSSALDPIAECEMYDSILKSSHNRIMFLVSHRLSSVQKVDQIYMLNNGKILNSGTHDQLMGNCKSYAEMYIKQAKSYIVK